MVVIRIEMSRKQMVTGIKNNEERVINQMLI